MADHSLLHTIAFWALSFAVIIYVLGFVMRFRRGEKELVKHDLPMFIGLCLMLVANILSGGPHQDAANIIGGLASLVLLVGSIKVIQWSLKQQRDAAQGSPRRERRG